jgi:hypothetical protein
MGREERVHGDVAKRVTVEVEVGEREKRREGECWRVRRGDRVVSDPRRRGQSDDAQSGEGIRAA